MVENEIANVAGHPISNDIFLRKLQESLLPSYFADTNYVGGLYYEIGAFIFACTLVCFVQIGDFVNQRG